MAAGDIGRTGVAVIAVLAVALLLLPDSAEAGSCTGGNRVNHRDAECLNAWWKNRGLLRKSPYHVRNMCSGYGEVVAKVDLKSAMDRTLHLNDGDWRDGQTSHRIRGISCCKDTGDLCNRSDVVTDEGCLARFLEVSPAASRCRNPTASAAISGEDYNCTITAKCLCGYFGPKPYYKDTSVTVPYSELDDLKICGGELKPGGCRPDLVRLSVGDAQAREADGATLDFRVTLNRPYPETVTVRYMTLDGTATAGSDYTATSGRLAFAPGQTSRTVSVPVLDDDMDEGWEAMMLRMSDPRPREAYLGNTIGSGKIMNSDPMPKAWIARFGRTVADQVLNAVDARMRATPAPGAEAWLAGQRIDLGPSFGAGLGGDPGDGETPVPDMEAGETSTPPDLAGWTTDGAAPTSPDFGPNFGSPEFEQATMRDLLPDASFSLTTQTGGEGLVSVWGAGAGTRFSGREDALSVDGKVASGLLGADWTRGRWTAGLVASHSQGDGGYRGAGRPGSGTGGRVSARMTGVWPWMRHALGERLSVWAVAGYGEGTLTLETPGMDGAAAGTIRTGLGLAMAAVGLRGLAVDGGDDGVSLAVMTDAVTAHTASGAVSGPGGNLAAAEAEVTRLRFGLEGLRPLRLAGGAELTPSLEIGLRHDGSDAETGLGADIGAGLAWTDPENGLSAELRGRGLLAHEAKGFREHGLSGSFTWEPAEGGRGPRLSLSQTVGVSTPVGTDALLTLTTLAGLAANDNGDKLQRRRLETRFGYGFAAFGDRFTATPEVAVGLTDTGRDYSVGWQLVHGGEALDESVLELAVEGRRHESTLNDNAPPEHAVSIRATSRF